MARQNEPQPQTQALEGEVGAKAETPLVGERKPGRLDQYLERLPPRYRTKRWLIGAPAAAVIALLLLIQCGGLALGGSDDPPPVAVAVTEPTPTPEPTPIPREEYQLPRQYAFVHFVNEMAACYDQNGTPATLESVEADIMADVPSAVATLMGLYAADRCEEVEPWHQIQGRAGWMLRASGMHEHLPEPPKPEDAK